RVGKPRVSYRETLRSPVKVEGEFSRQNPAQFAKLTVDFGNARKDTPISVVSRVPAEKLPPLLAAAAERGLDFGWRSGIVGFSLLHVHATIVDAQVDPQLSTEIAFEAAATHAVSNALRHNILLLEPIMRVEVQVPDEFYGAITADLNAKRAEITKSE